MQYTITLTTQYTTMTKEFICKCNSLFYIFFIILFFALFTVPSGIAGNRPDMDVPVNPRTIAEYDTVAGVVMYWNPGNNSNYDYIVMAVANGIQSRATLFFQTNSDSHRLNMINTLSSNGIPLDNIVFIGVYGDRIWIRDHGPFSIYDDDHLAFVGFNDLATNHGDQDLPERLAQYWDLNYYDFPHIIFDGGNYLVDNHNRLFATNRLYTNNPGIPPEHIDTILETYMGIEEIHTFQALSNDYWGHLDMQVKLLNDTTFVISKVDSWHADYQILQDNLAVLESLTHPKGKDYQIVQIHKADNWKTYINSLIVNDAVLVPTYNHALDAIALQAYQDLMPGKEIIGIDCNAMIGWEGAIHCITNQLPPFQAVQDDDDDDDNGDDDNGDDDNGDDDNGDDDNGDDDNGDDDNGDDDNGDDDDGDETKIREVDSGILTDSFCVFPNPASDIALIEFTVERQDDYQLEIMDMTGATMRRVNIPAWYTGDYSVAVNAAEMDSGTYIIRLSGSHGSWSLRLVVP